MVLPIYNSAVNSASDNRPGSVSSTLKRLQERLSQVAHDSKGKTTRKIVTSFDTSPIRQVSSEISPINLSESKDGIPIEDGSPVVVEPEPIFNTLRSNLMIQQDDPPERHLKQTADGSMLIQLPEEYDKVENNVGKLLLVDLYTDGNKEQKSAEIGTDASSIGNIKTSNSNPLFSSIKEHIMVLKTRSTPATNSKDEKRGSLRSVQSATNMRQSSGTFEKRLISNSPSIKLIDPKKQEELIDGAVITTSMDSASVPRAKFAGSRTVSTASHAATREQQTTDLHHPQPHYPIDHQMLLPSGEFDQSIFIQKQQNTSPNHLIDLENVESNHKLSTPISLSHKYSNDGNNAAGVFGTVTDGNEKEPLLNSYQNFNQDTIGHRSYQSATTTTNFSNVAFYGVPLIDGNASVGNDSRLGTTSLNAHRQHSRHQSQVDIKRFNEIPEQEATGSSTLKAGGNSTVIISEEIDNSRYRQANILELGGNDGLGIGYGSRVVVNRDSNDVSVYSEDIVVHRSMSHYFIWIFLLVLSGAVVFWYLYPGLWI
ncbi:unnamed protein product [Ambrosiozyma monospora]|uniref:Unnamed protein product n=1 Tax=Ambrosiozyma monospora TaxID=43982 RepID=A0A9W6YR04_AMBMO|nr:unnamed protein product [Ambrosiozyma monospora]